MPKLSSKRISVVIPAHNREHFIGSAITSVLNQKLPKEYAMEIIVIDDGSTDNTKRIVNQFNDKVIYKRIMASGRPAIPRNIGIKMAKGDLIAFQDSDDLWVKDKLIKQLPAFDDPKIVLSYGNAEFMDEDGRRAGRTIITSEQAVSGEVFMQLLDNNFISTLTVMVRRKNLVEAGLFDETWGLRGIEDYELWLRMARLGRFQFVNETLAYYRTHDGNISSKDHYTSYMRLVNVFKAVVKKPGLSREERKATTKRLTQAYADLANHAKGIKKVTAQSCKQIYRLRTKVI